MRFKPIVYTRLPPVWPNRLGDGIDVGDDAVLLNGTGRPIFAVHAHAQRPRCGLLSTRQPLDQLVLHPESCSPGFLIGTDWFSLPGV